MFKAMNLDERSKFITKVAFKSRAGNTVMGSRKTNQDSFLALPYSLELSNMGIFGVFDGHGKDNNILNNINKNFRRTRTQMFRRHQKLSY